MSDAAFEHGKMIIEALGILVDKQGDEVAILHPETREQVTSFRFHPDAVRQVGRWGATVDEARVVYEALLKWIK